MKLTEFELMAEARKYYKSFLTLEKAKKILELENIPYELVEDDFKTVINTQLCINNDIDPEHMLFMKKLQESGEVNMLAAIPTIQQSLLLDREEARKVHNFYLKKYAEIFNPASCI